MNRKTSRLVVCSMVLVLLIRVLAVADIPFYYAGATAVDPQISSLIVGVNETIGQAVVSHDRKYVTLDVDLSLSDSLGIKTFTFQKSAIGFVGSAAASRAGAPGAISGSLHPNQAAPEGSLTPSIAVLPSELDKAQSPLEKPGMTFISSLVRH